ncbi:MAG: hypothetical protein FD126_2318 [Elusimicrobia bacterium]|nr:MAG: hypothetical protein FD126_2318 [Elusimicrobiota bacterium]
MSDESLPGPTRGAGVGFGASGGAFLASLVIGGTIGVVAFALKAMGVAEDDAFLDPWVRAGGAVAALALVGLMVNSVAGALRRRTLADRGAMALDYAWPADGVQSAGTWVDALRSVGVIAFSVFVGGFLPTAYFQPPKDVALPLFVVGGAVGGFLGYLFGGGALVQYRRYGASRLKLPPGPLPPGESMLAELETSADLSRAELVLRCVRETIVGTGKHARVVRTQTAGGRVSQRQATTSGLQFVLTPPEDAAPNSLATHPPLYWELYVNDEAAAFEAYFLVPVYPRPRPR